MPTFFRGGWGVEENRTLHTFLKFSPHNRVSKRVFWAHFWTFRVCVCFVHCPNVLSLFAENRLIYFVSDPVYDKMIILMSSSASESLNKKCLSQLLLKQINVNMEFTYKYRKGIEIHWTSISFDYIFRVDKIHRINILNPFFNVLLSVISRCWKCIT